MAGLVDSLVRMPIRRASRAIRLVPIFSPSSAKTELSDAAVADHSEAVPRYESS